MSFRLTPEEKHVWLKSAARAGMTLADCFAFFEDPLLSEPIPLVPNRGDLIRARIRVRLEAAGLRYRGKESRHGALLLFENSRKQPVRIMTYIVNTLNRSGQCCFTVRNVNKDRVDWVALVAVPLDVILLRRMAEVRHPHLLKHDGVPDQVNVTLRKGTDFYSDDFDRRLPELLE